MNSKVFYGEYSLMHWINLMQNGNICLPPYQRHFVWTESKVRTLIETFRKRQFVPSVIIGAFKQNGNNVNLILDGQQRLTSILLAYFGLFPEAKTYKKQIEQFANENDDTEDNQDEYEDILEWTFEVLIKQGHTEDHYKKVDYGIDDDFLKNTYLGFSYLVPCELDVKKQQEYYSSVFRHINIQGTTLLPQESRKSLYYSDDTYCELFEPDLCKTIKCNDAMLDFVRYLSLLSNYHMTQSADSIARGYKLKMEKYYEEYIDAVVNSHNVDIEQSCLFANFNTIFPDNNYKPAIRNLCSAIGQMKVPHKYLSIIDMDMFWFGLIYITLFKHSTIDSVHYVELRSNLQKRISEYKSDPSHIRAPGALKYLRLRIESSIQIYSKYETA